jgi:hypothetical protein
MKALHASYQAREAAAAKGPSPRQASTFDIDTFIHVIQADNSDDGFVSESQIGDQVCTAYGFYLSCLELFISVVSLHIFYA